MAKAQKKGGKKVLPTKSKEKIKINASFEDILKTAAEGNIKKKDSKR